MERYAPVGSVVVVGAGPAGLAAAHRLAEHGARPLVLEKSHTVGGIARTERYKGYHFDMGGHRFFTKSQEVAAFWRQALGDNFLRRPRLSRIYYKQQFFHYPLKPFDVVSRLGLFESAMILASYARWQVFPHRREATFAEWVTNRFGRRLFRTFFKSYTEKVWGISTDELNAEWAAQRIKNLSVKSVLMSMVVKPGTKITSLIEEFDYPRRGPGMMWAAVADGVGALGGEVRLRSEVVRLRRDGLRVTAAEVRGPDGVTTVAAEHVITSMPITELVAKLDPPAPEPVRAAAARLTYRDFLTVGLIVRREHLFRDNWIYVHDPDVKVGRIQNFKNWSPEMVADPATTSLGLEYFCNEGDALWTMPDAELVELAKREVEQLGLAKAADVEDGCVFRVPKSYPVYDGSFREHLQTVRTYVDALENVQTIGRNGLHRYDNQDHAMLTGILAARNLLFGEQNDVWRVNTEREYHEEAKAAGSGGVGLGGAVPQRS